MAEIKLFNLYSYDGVKAIDPGLIKYINLKPVIVPKTGQRITGTQFKKSELNIVERLVNKLMVVGHRSKKHTITSGHNTGKTANAIKIVKEAFRIVAEKTKQNPLQVLVTAIENAATREEIIAIEYGGARYPKAVECAPQRRVDLVLRLMTQGTYNKSFNKKKRAHEALADEIISAFTNSAQSSAASKKHELERQADSSR